MDIFDFSISSLCASFDMHESTFICTLIKNVYLHKNGIYDCVYPALIRVYGESCNETLHESRKQKSSGLSKKSSQPVVAISLYLCLFE